MVNILSIANADQLELLGFYFDSVEWKGNKMHLFFFLLRKQILFKLLRTKNLVFQNRDPS